MDPEKPSPTVMASAAKSAGTGKKGEFWCHPTSVPPRRVSTLEAKGFHGFPLTYLMPINPSFPVATKSQEFKIRWRMIGNAVCPPVAKAIAKSILSEFEK